MVGSGKSLCDLDLGSLRFFCASLLMNQPFSQKTLNAATLQLQTTLESIANQHVRKYAGIIRKNAETKARIGYVPAAALNAQAVAEKNAAVSTQTLAKIVPGGGNVQPSTASQVNTLIANIAKYNTREQLNKVKNNQRYKNANNKARINNAVNNRKLELITPIV
jgi:hypothetical protein